MRVAVLGAGGSHKTEASIVRAARALGHESRLVDVVWWRRYAGPLAGRAIRYRTDAFAPEFLVLTRHAIRAGASALRALLRGRAAAFWYFDLEPKPAVVELGRLVGRICITSPERRALYQAAGIPRVDYLPQGVDPEMDVPETAFSPDLRCDVSFVGSGQYPHRFPVLRAVAEVASLQIRGPGWSSAPSDLPVAGGPVHGRELGEVIAAADISLGAHATAAQDGERATASNRMWKVLGRGGFYLGPWVPDIERFAAGGVHCAWYRSPADAAEQTRAWLDQPGERRRVAAAGRAHALRHHTYAARIALMLAGQGLDLDALSTAGSDQRVIPELEHPHAGKPLDRP